MPMMWWYGRHQKATGPRLLGRPFRMAWFGHPDTLHCWGENASIPRKKKQLCWCFLREDIFLPSCTMAERSRNLARNIIQAPRSCYSGPCVLASSSPADFYEVPHPRTILPCLFFLGAIPLLAFVISCLYRRLAVCNGNSPRPFTNRTFERACDYQHYLLSSKP